MKMYRSLIVGILFVMMLTATGCQPSQEKSVAEPVAIAGEPAHVEKTTPPVVQRPEGEVQKVEPAANVPILTVENPTHDFGEMGPSASAKCEYKFSNTGTAVLKIDRVQSTCGCTVPQLKKKEYAPGESGVVTVTFRAPSVKGKVNKHLYIISNDPKNPRFELGIKAEVVVKVSISPETVNLRLDQDNAGMPEIIVKSSDDKEFAIKSVTVAREVMTVPIDPAKRAKEFVLKPTVDIQKLNEFTTGVIQVKTDHPQAGTLVVRYNAIPKYEVSRPRIILQNVEPGAPLEKDVIIRSNYGTPVEIESVTSRNGYMEIASQERDGEHLKMMVKITPPSQENTSRRYITDEMTLVLKDQTKLTIRCSGWFKLN